MTHLIAIGTRKGLWLARSTDRRTWTLDGPHLLMQEVPSVVVDTRGDQPRLLVGTYSWHWGPTVVWSDDLGATWSETEHASLEFPADTGAAVARVWQLVPDAHRPGVVWAGVEPSSLWRSDDEGRTFALVRELWDHPHKSGWDAGQGGAAIHTVLPAADGSVLIAMSTGGVYVSADGETGWEARNRGIDAGFLPGEDTEYGQCVHKVAADPAGTLYAQNHGGVYRSDDSGRTWRSIDDGLPADFGFVMLASPREAGRVWVVPLQADQARIPVAGRMRVHTSGDGGATWAESEAGLPDDAYTVVLRDAACVDDADPTGVYLGTRDGCVYASADGGRTFVTVAEHLPDVLCVRAAVV